MITTWKIIISLRNFILKVATNKYGRQTIFIERINNINILDKILSFLWLFDKDSLVNIVNIVD